MQLSWYDAVPMVPCSELSEMFDLESLPGAVFCSREEEAVAVGAGLWLAGKSPLVMMQSSGLMSSLNTVGSLLVTYAIPVTILVAMRGGVDERNCCQLPVARAVRPSLLALGCLTVTTSRDGLLSALADVRASCAAQRGTVAPTVVLVA